MVTSRSSQPRTAGRQARAPLAWRTRERRRESMRCDPRRRVNGRPRAQRVRRAQRTYGHRAAQRSTPVASAARVAASVPAAALTPQRHRPAGGRERWCREQWCREHWCREQWYREQWQGSNERTRQRPHAQPPPALRAEGPPGGGSALNERYRRSCDVTVPKVSRKCGGYPAADRSTDWRPAPAPTADGEPLTASTSSYSVPPALPHSGLGRHGPGASARTPERRRPPRNRYR